MRDLLYVLLGLGGLCVLEKLIVNGMYHRLIREARRMGKSGHPLMKILLKKFETCYQLKMGVENVRLFVDKYLNDYRIARLHLYSWEALGDVIFGVILLVSLLATLYIAIMGYGQRLLAEFLLTGVGVCGGILLVDVILNPRFKRTCLAIEIRDYLENVYKPRLENITFKSEEMEKYHREYFEEERAKLDELLAMKQEETVPQVQFTKEEEEIIEEVLREYIV